MSTRSETIGVNGVKFGEPVTRLVRACNPELSLGSAPTAIRSSKRMAIWAQQAQVLEPVVLVVTVDVIELEWYRLA